MDQPPTAVMLSFVPEGKLRLYRLGEHTPFHCVRCQQDKTAILVATKGGDWKQTVCNACYDSLIMAQSEASRAQSEAARAQREAKTAEKRHPAQMKQPSTKVKPKEKRKPPQLSTTSEQQLQRRMPGIEHLLVFFRAAGVTVEVKRRGRLVINGTPTGPLAWIPPTREVLDWNSVIDEIALKCVGSKFLLAVGDNAHFGKGYRALLRQDDWGIAVMRDDVQLAMIHATSAWISHGDVIYGNFLKPGPHWQQLTDAVHSLEAELVTKRKQEQEARAAAEAAAAEAEAERRRATTRRRIDRLPNNLVPELIDACLDASRRIRLERQVAYERPVVLESGFGELTLLPIIGTTSRLLMPFHLKKGTETLKGKLVLGDCDPLPLLISEDVADDDAVTAWTCALLGFADATCIEFESAELNDQRAPTKPRWHPPSSTSQHPPSTRTLPRKRWPRHLEPVGPWVEHQGAFVVGHRRRLTHGQTASDEARDRARQVGIILRPHETWVQAHTRGVPEGIEMRFMWHTPTTLRLSHT
jgi:hypothetical protein